VEYLTPKRAATLVVLACCRGEVLLPQLASARTQSTWCGVSSCSTLVHGTRPLASMEEARVTLRERLEQLVRYSPRGTLIPIEGLAELITAAEDEEKDLAVEDVGRLAAWSFGRKADYSPGAIRKWIRSGLRGVRLPAYPSSSGYRVRPRDFEQFVSEVRGQRPNRPPRDEPVGSEIGLEDHDIEAELQAGQRAYAASVH
jgi:hypothetical protein